MSALIQVGNQFYELVEDVKGGYNEEVFIERYSEILNKYDFIVGDWGYSQLRLRGFYDDRNARSTYDTKISTLQEYMLEYCNFGCSYFVLKKVVKPKENPSRE